MQQGGAQYEMAPTSRPQMLGIPTSDQLQQPPAEAASPISTRLPAGIDETVEGNYATEDVYAMPAGEEPERGVPGGNRWPRQETLALLKIRSDMDAAFREAMLKGPLWEDVSRKLAEMGYNRSAKKCKEKFENVHKYYKRTKDKCGGRKDGKSYRFFSQLEALNNSTSATAASLPSPSAATCTFGPGSGMEGRAQQRPTPITSIAPSSSNAPPPPAAPMDPTAASTQLAGLFGLSSNTSSSGSLSNSDGEDTEEGVPVEEGRRKRKQSSGRSHRKMRNFFKGLMQQVLARQEAMQARFLETIEKREQDRMIREEAWRRQEMARLCREHELNAQERAMAATRDNSIIAFIQKITGQTILLPVASPPVAGSPQPPPPPHQQQPPAPAPSTLQKRQPPPTSAPVHQVMESTTSRPLAPVTQTTTMPEGVAASAQVQSAQELASAGGSVDPSSSRWPKVEVHALITIRSEMEPRYLEAGPKGPLWEEISAAMRRMGYNRSAKRCKEKWENINKYFKKVKESSKKRLEDSKTCPYFHQLEELYRKKVIGGGSSQQEAHEQVNPEVQPITTLPPPATSTQRVGCSGDGNGGNSESRVVSAATNGGGGRSPTFPEEGAGTRASPNEKMKKPEDIVKELMGRDYGDEEDNVGDSFGVGDEDEDGEQQKMAYTVELQRSNMGGASNNGGSAAVPATTTTASTASSSFLAMVK